MFALLFAHGDPFTLVIFLVIHSLSEAAENAGPILAVLLKLAGVLLVLPMFVLVIDFLTGIATAAFVRKKRWLFVVVSAEALLFYVVFCVPAAAVLLNDWYELWAWLTIGFGGLFSILAGLLNGAMLVALVAFFSRLTRKKSKANAHG